MTACAVSVVVPTRNRRDLLELALRSVWAQSFADLEVIVIDEGSTDATPEFLAQLRDARVRAVRHDIPKGLAAARNAGLAVARGRWVAFLDDDDLWAPEKVAAQIEAIRATPGARWAATGAVRVDAQLRIIGWHRLRDSRDVLRRLINSNVVPAGGSGVLVESGLLRELGGFREDLVSAQDWDCWIRLARTSALAVVDAPLTAYRVWPLSMSHDVELENAAITTIHGMHREPGVPCDVRPTQRYLARMDFESGRRAAAAKRFLRLSRAHPRYGLWAAAALVMPREVERPWCRIREPVLWPGWRRRANAWLAPYRTHADAPRP